MDINENQKVELLEPGVMPGRRVLPQFIATRRFEVGKIKIGGRSKEKYSGRDGKEYRRPVKYAYFAITTNERDETTDSFKPDADVYAALKTDKPMEIPIFFYDNEPWMTQFAFYTARGKYCAGDGFVALRLIDGSYKPIKCPNLQCEHHKSGLCKKWGILICGIQDISKGIGSTYVFRTKGQRTIAAINNVLNDFIRLTHGNIAGIPFKLKFYHQTAEDKDGKRHKIPVISLEYSGGIDDLRQRVLDIRGAEQQFDSKFGEKKVDRAALAAPQGVKDIMDTEAGMTHPEAAEHFEEFRGEKDPAIPGEVESQFDKVDIGKSADDIAAETDDELDNDGPEDPEDVDEEIGGGKPKGPGAAISSAVKGSAKGKTKKRSSVEGFKPAGEEENFV